MDDDTQLWGGAFLLVLGAVILLAPVVTEVVYNPVLLVVAVLGLAAGAILVGASRRGRSV